MKILVTGGAGYLGSVLCEHLLSEGHYVRVLDNLIFGKSPLNSCLKHPRFELVVGDKRDTRTVRSTLEDVDTVIDLAAVVGNAACKEYPKACKSINADATDGLYDLSAKQGVERFIFASTCSLYAGCNGRKGSEEDSVRPTSLYTRSKFIVEKRLEKSKNDLDATVVRLPTLCGPSPRMRFDLVLNRMAAMAIQEGKVIVNGGNQWRPILDVRDAASCLTWLADGRANVNGFHLLNIGSEQTNMQIASLAELISNRILGTEVATRNPCEKPSSYQVDFSRISDMGFRPSFGLEKSLQGIRKFFAKSEIENYAKPIYNNSKMSYDSECT